MSFYFSKTAYFRGIYSKNNTVFDNLLDLPYLLLPDSPCYETHSLTGLIPLTEHPRLSELRSAYAPCTMKNFQFLEQTRLSSNSDRTENKLDLYFIAVTLAMERGESGRKRILLSSKL